MDEKTIAKIAKNHFENIAYTENILNRSREVMAKQIAVARELGRRQTILLAKAEADYRAEFRNM